MKNTLLLSSLLMVIGFIVYSCNTGKQTPDQNIERPTIALMVWDERAMEGSDAAELQFFQLGKPQPDLRVKYSISGTARNGYDFRNSESIRIRNSKASLIIKPVDDFLYEGNSLLHIAMRQKEIPHEFRIRDGAHTWQYWREALPEVLGFISKAFHR